MPTLRPTPGQPAVQRPSQSPDPARPGPGAPSGARKDGPGSPQGSSPVRGGGASPEGRVDEEDIVLRLAIGRDGVGLELEHPAPLACARVTELTATLPGMRFPVDVSGGVPRFRHRWSALQTLQVEIDARALERWAAPRLRGIVGTRSPAVWVAVRPMGATVSIAAEAVADVDDASPARATPVVAFDVDVLIEQADLVLVVKRARGADLPAPAAAVAIACAEAVLGNIAKRQGAAFFVRGAPRGIARALLPRAGARVPATEGVVWASVGAHAETWTLHAMRGSVAAPPAGEALRAREAASLLREGDDALMSGDWARARDLYLDALERAPRHGEIARRILQIDARTPGAAEAALATLADARQGTRDDPPFSFGTTPGELLREVGDLDAAIASLERVGETEPTPVLAARAFEMAGRLVRDPDEACRLLDQAIARAPRSASARWLRIDRRLDLGRLEDALADAEHLEALAKGVRAKHAVWLRAGRAWHAARRGGQAGVLFERALRFAPEEPQALAGLGAALLGEGREARGVAVLTHAIELADARHEPTAPMILELSRALAERLDDLPTAIARISTISADVREAAEARGLEGRWRARLGDVAGAALAFARLRELASSYASPEQDARGEIIAALLGEAAELHDARLHDALGAQRHLASALRFRPRDPPLLRAYREVGERLATDHEGELKKARPEGFAPNEPPSAVHRASAAERPLQVELAAASEPELTAEEVRASARVEELTRRLQSDPKDDAAADELASLLEALGRGHELLALLIARLEDATPDRRAALAPKARSALVRLAEQAEAAGRLEEAALYRATIAGLEDERRP